MSPSSSEIKVIVKSPAQRCEDQTIVCNLDWTVSKLKFYISEHFPIKPAVSDQRLIYSGHLLKNEKTLKEIFKPTEQDNSTFTLHLVFSQKNDKEQQNISETSNTPSSNHSDQLPTSNSNISRMGFNLTYDPSIDLTSLYLQQMQQYQRLYVNYMTQFLNQNNLDHSQQPNFYNSIYNLPVIIDPMFLNSLLTLPNLTDVNSLNHSSNNLNTNSNNSTSNINQLLPNQNTNENQAQNNVNDVDLQNDLQNDGWINMINIFWNILIVLSLLSASYSRTMFVFTIGFCYYLYQSGFFANIFARFFGDFTPNTNNRNPVNNEEQIQQMINTNNTNTSEARQRIANDQENITAVDDQPEQHVIYNKFRFFCMVISSLFSSLMLHNEPTVPNN